MSTNKRRASATSSRKAKPSLEPKVRPLIARPGANFQCFGDGLCCTDIHALGPITRSETKAMRAIHKLSVVYNEDVEDNVLAPTKEGGCFFLRESGCSLHAKHGPESKPTGCQRFPYGLIATPDGGRVSTEHRCPCRTLGDRPALSLDDAAKSLRDQAGRLEVDERVGNSIRLTQKQRVSFARYKAIETNMLERLAAGERAEDVLAAKALPKLKDQSWAVRAVGFYDMRDGTSGGEAVTWFGDALLHLATGHTPPAERARPWRPSFERSIKRTTRMAKPAELWNDWLSDELWMMRWYPWGPFDVARAEMATRLAVVQLLTKLIEARGTRADQAAAEAITIVDVATATTEWPDIAEDIAREPSPAEPLLA